jgi:hypothetical protein
MNLDPASLRDLARSLDRLAAAIEAGAAKAVNPPSLGPSSNVIPMVSASQYAADRYARSVHVDPNLLPPDAA